jgi:hypothetical protein
MPVVALLFIIAGIGLIAWLLVTFVPMDPTIRRIFVVVAVILIIVLVLHALGAWDAIWSVRVPRVQ